MIPFLTAKLLGIPRWLWAVVALVLLYVAVVMLEASDDKNNQAIGATAEREAQVTEVLERTETGNAVREQAEREIGSGTGTIAYDQCMRYDRNAASGSCERFLPQRPDAERSR